MRRTIATTLFLVFLISLSAFPAEPGGSTRQPHPMQTWIKKHSVRKGLIGALGGAVAGVIVAAATGNQDDAAKFAAVGAGIGGLVGFKLGRSQDQMIALRDETISRHQYAGEGFAGGVESVGISADQAKPGQTISVTAGFWAIAPDARKQFKVDRMSGLRYPGLDDYAGAQPVNPSPFAITGGGQWVSTFAFTIPPNLPPGTYDVEVVLDSKDFDAPVSAKQRITVTSAS